MRGPLTGEATVTWPKQTDEEKLPSQETGIIVQLKEKSRILQMRKIVKENSGKASPNGRYLFNMARKETKTSHVKTAKS